MILPNPSQLTNVDAKSGTLLPNSTDANLNPNPTLSTGMAKEGGWGCCCCRFGGSQKKRVMRKELKEREREQCRAQKWNERQGKQGIVDLEHGFGPTTGPSTSECPKKDSVKDPQRDGDGKELYKGDDVNLEGVGPSSITSDPPPRYE